MHAIVPIFSLVGQLATEMNEHANRKRRGEKCVGMLAKAKHQKFAVRTGEIAQRMQCEYVDLPNVEPGWACCHCNVYNGLWRGECKQCEHRRCPTMIHTGALIETGELQKLDPLPPGRYWIDVFEPKLAIFQAWFLTSPNVAIENQETFEAIETDETKYPARTWYLFVVKAATPWGKAADLGWPTIAGPDVHTSDDTVQKPKPEDIPLFPSGPPDFFNPDKWSPSTKFLVVGGVVLVVAVAASYAIRGFR